MKALKWSLALGASVLLHTGGFLFLTAHAQPEPSVNAAKGEGSDGFEIGLGQLGSYENVRLGFTFGYQYKLMNNFYINGWGGIYALMTGDTEAPVGSKTVYFDEGVPLISIDIGWYY